MDCTDGFPETLKKKIKKMSEARSGTGIYKKRNNREYRVIMHLKTFNSLSDEQLKIYTNGYAVRITPSDYFLKTKEIDKRIKLGENAFVYYKKKEDLDNYRPKKEWKEVLELVTCSDSNYKNLKTWIGEYAKFVPNTSPKELSIICSDEELTDNKKETLKSEYKLSKIPKQSGLGNYDFDFCNREEQKKISYQMAKLIWNTRDMKEKIIALFNEKNVFDRNHKFGSDFTIEKIDETILHIDEFCNDNGLFDEEKLLSNRIIHYSTKKLFVLSA